MKKISKKISLGALLFLISFVFSINFALASYDVYVDKSNDGEEDGSSEKPFNSLEEALEEKSSNAKIYIKNGTYNEKVTVGNNIDLQGESKSAVINGTLTLKNGASLNNLTVTGNTTGVSVEKDAKVSISDCVIRNSLSTGINLVQGNGKLVLKNSKIYKNQKGLYIQLGNQIEITGSDIYENREEGIDVRAKVDGKISGNNIYGNKESGIEIVVGSSDISISNNNIKNNSASGIAAQFYSDNKKTGQMKVEKNKITKNSSYGFNCKAPSGGKVPKGYWKDSIELGGNTIDNNKRPAIAKSCKLIEATDEDEEKDNAIVEDPNAIKEDELRAKQEEEKAKKEEEKIAEENRQREEAERIEKINKDIQVKTEKDALNEKTVLVVNDSLKRTEKIKSTSKFKKVFFGVKQEEIDLMNKNISELEKLSDQLKVMKETAVSEETKNEIDLEIQELEKNKKEFQNIVVENDGKKGVFGWIVGLFS